MTFLDISHAVLVTNTGLQAFKGKQFNITHLVLAGLTSVGSQGLFDIISSCNSNLVYFDGSLMDQEGLDSKFIASLAYAFKLEELDLSGCTNLPDDGFHLMCKGVVKNEDDQEIYPGFDYLRTLKLNGVKNLTDHNLLKICAMAKCLSHLEITKCESLTEYSIEMIVKT